MIAVVDASALVELLVRSVAAPLVEAVIGESDSFAPELLDVEVGSAIAGLERRGTMTSRDAGRALHALVTAPITRVPHLGLLPEAWKLRGNLSLYDAMYVALAGRLRCPLVTADRRLTAAPGLPVAVTLV